MALGNFFGSLFGGGSKEPETFEGEAQEYQGYTIRATPRREGGQWLTAGTIAKEIGGELQQQSFIRADTHPTREDAEACALGKARTIIDQQGDKLFDGRP